MSKCVKCDICEKIINEESAFIVEILVYNGDFPNRKYHIKEKFDICYDCYCSIIENYKEVECRSNYWKFARFLGIDVMKEIFKKILNKEVKK